jgi:hypothetical protein
MSSLTPKPVAAPRRMALKLAVLLDDVVLEEVHQRKAVGLTVGSHYGNDVLLFGAEVPHRHALFDVDREGRYGLNVPPGAAGTVQIGRRTIPLAKLRAIAGDGELRLNLPTSAKGDLRLGDTRIVFEFAPPAPTPPLLPFPPEFRVRFNELLNRTEAGSFGAAALVLGSYFTYVGTAEYDDTIDPDSIDERFVYAMGLEKKPEEPIVPEEEPDEEDALAQEDEEKVEDKKEPDKPIDKPIEQPRPDKQYSAQSLEKARGVGVMRTLVTYGDSGQGSAFDVLDSTENRLGELFAQGMTQTIMADGGDISAFVPGGEGIEQYGAAVQSEGLATGDAPELADKPGMRERVVTSKIDTTGKTDIFGDVDKRAVQATIRRRMGALKSCHEKILRTDPSVGGKMTFTIAISVMGSVTSVQVEEDTVGNASLAACAKAKLQGWRFPMQGAEEPADVTFSVVFQAAQ